MGQFHTSTNSNRQWLAAVVTSLAVVMGVNSCKMTADDYQMAVNVS